MDYTKVKEAFERIKEKSEEMSDKEIKEKAKSLFKRCELKDSPVDHFLYSYFCYTVGKIEEKVVNDNHWVFFRHGWQAAPFFMSVFDNDESDEKRRIQMFRYLFALLVPEHMRDDIFSKQEISFLNNNHRTPNFIGEEIKLLILKNKDKAPELSKCIKKYMLKLLKCIRKEKESSGFKGYDPSESFRGYQLPDSF